MYNPKRSILYPFEQLTVDSPFVIAITILQYNLHNNNDDTTANNVTVLIILLLLINLQCYKKNSTYKTVQPTSHNHERYPKKKKTIISLDFFEKIHFLGHNSWFFSRIVHYCDCVIGL